jgi:hypothetical protein
MTSGDFTEAIAPNTWVTIKGGFLSGTMCSWTISDFNNQDLLTKLDGVSVTVNNEQDFVSYISPTQINFLTPARSRSQADRIVTTNNGPTSAGFLLFLSRGPGRRPVSGTWCDDEFYRCASWEWCACDLSTLYVNGLGPTMLGRRMVSLRVPHCRLHRPCRSRSANSLPK